MKSQTELAFELSEKRTVFIGGIPSNAEEDIIYSYFCKFGTIQSLKIISKKQAIISDTAFCFITYEQEDSAKKSLEVESHFLYGRPVTCRPFMQGNTLQEKNEDEFKRRIFVKYIPQDMNESQFKVFFQGFGAVENSYLVKYSKEGSLISTVGYVTFEDVTVAEQLIKRRNLKYKRRKLKVQSYQRENGRKAATPPKQSHEFFPQSFLIENKIENQAPAALFSPKTLDPSLRPTSSSYFSQRRPVEAQRDFDPSYSLILSNPYQNGLNMRSNFRFNISTATYIHINQREGLGSQLNNSSMLREQNASMNMQKALHSIQPNKQPGTSKSELIHSEKILNLTSEF